MRTSALLTLAAASSVIASPIIARNGGKSCPSKTSTTTPTWGHPTPTPTPTWGEPPATWGEPAKPAPTWGEPAPTTDPAPVKGVVCKGKFYLNILSCNNVNLNLGLNILGKRTWGEEEPEKPEDSVEPVVGVICEGYFVLNVGSCNNLNVKLPINVGKAKRGGWGEPSESLC
jgi:hypothetical protein